MPRFTRNELIEIRRALDLISQEDAACGVNMDAASVKAKASVERKVSKALGVKSTAEPEPSCESINVLAVLRGGE